MKKLLVSMAIVLFLFCTASAVQPMISLDRLNWTQSLPDGENITMDDGFLAGTGGIAFNGTAPTVTDGILYSNAGELEFDGQPVIPNYYYIYTGTTGSGLDDFIELHGPGTYQLTNPITISSGIFINTSGVCVLGSVNGIYNVSLGGSIGSSMLSGSAITIAADNVFLNGLYIYNSDAASSASLVTFHKTYPDVVWRCKVEDCRLDPKGGTGIELLGSRIIRIIRLDVEGDNIASSTGVQIGEASDGADNIDIYLQDSHIGAVGYGIKLIHGEGIFINGGDVLLNKINLMIDPYADDSVVNVISRGVCYDSSTETSVYAPGNFLSRRLIFDNVWGYSETAAVYHIKNVNEISITGGRAETAVNNIYIHCILLDDVSYPLVSGCLIKTAVAGSAGIWCASGVINGTIIGNSINTPGVGIALDTNANENIVVGNSVRGGIYDSGTGNVILADSNNVA